MHTVTRSDVVSISTPHIQEEELELVVFYVLFCFDLTCSVRASWTLKKRANFRQNNENKLLAYENTKCDD